MAERKCTIRDKWIIRFVFFALFLLVHIPWIYWGDDLAVLPRASEISLYERFLQLYTFNGKICTDLFAFLIYRIPFILWKILDSIIYVVIASLLSFLFTKNTPINLLTANVLLLMFPFHYLITAGYICVTTNYIYTTLCMLLIIVPIKSAHEKKRIHPLWHIVVFTCIFYATNQDQSAMVLIGGFILYLIYLLYTRCNKQVLSLVVAYLILAVGCYLFMFLMPGHMNRMTSTVEMELYLPEYADWSFFKKVYKGYTSTVAHIMFEKVNVFIVFIILLFLLSLSHKKLITAFIGFIPLGIVLIEEIIGTEYFIYPVYNPIMDLYPLESGLIAFWGLICSFLILFSIFYIILSCTKNRARKWLLLSLLVLGAGSREMMGFSPTIYASSFRTFTYFIFALMICCLILLNELNEKQEKAYWTSGIAAIFLSLLL